MQRHRFVCIISDVEVLVRAQIYAHADMLKVSAALHLVALARGAKPMRVNSGFWRMAAKNKWQLSPVQKLFTSSINSKVRCPRWEGKYHGAEAASPAPRVVLLVVVPSSRLKIVSAGNRAMPCRGA